MKTKNLFSYVAFVWAIVMLLSALIFKSAGFSITLLALSFVAFIQNMSFTWVSRSRQSGDADYHRYAAWCSNGIWLLTQAFIALNVYTPIAQMHNTGADITDIGKIIFTFLIYAMATTEGSVLMMKALLGKVKLPIIGKYLVEKGNRQVGKRG